MARIDALYIASTRTIRINFLKALNSSEDAHAKSMSTFEIDEHLRERS
jgi:hypothetical protein